MEKYYFDNFKINIIKNKNKTRQNLIGSYKSLEYINYELVKLCRNDNDKEKESK